MKTVLLMFLAAGLARAADVHFAWFPFNSNLPGLPQTSTPVTQYGVEVLLDSDNPAVTQFEVTVVVQLSSGAIVPVHGIVPRQPKDQGVVYSSIFSFWVDSNPNFAVLAIQANAMAGQTATKPIPGKDYSNAPPPASME